MEIRRDVEVLPPIRLAPGGAFEDLDFAYEVDVLHDVVVRRLPEGTEAPWPRVSWLHTDVVVEPRAGRPVDPQLARAALPPAAAAYNYFHLVWELCAGAWVADRLAGPVDLVNTSLDWTRPMVTDALGTLVPRSTLHHLDEGSEIAVAELLVPRFWLRPRGGEQEHFERPRWAAAGYSRAYVDALRASFVPASAETGTTDAYLPRVDAQFRTDPRLPESRRVCDDLGVHVVESLWGTRIGDQAQEFARMRSLVAIHGAANANVCFLREGAALTEIFADGYAPGQFQIIADLAGLSYDHVVLPDTADSARDEPLRRSPEITPGLLREMLTAGARRAEVSPAPPVTGPGDTVPEPTDPTSPTSPTEIVIEEVADDGDLDPDLLEALRPWVRQFEPWWDPDRILEHLRTLWHPAPGQEPLDHRMLQRSAVALTSASIVSESGQWRTFVAFDTEEDWGVGSFEGRHLQSPALHVSAVDGGAALNLWGRIVILDAHDRVVTELSSEWWWLVAFYGADRSAIAASAPVVDSALVLANDTPSINFAHVLLDQVALAAAVGGRADGLRANTLTQVVGPTTQRWHAPVLDAHLRPLGGPIMALGWFTGVRADRLWIPGSPSLVPHPAYKGASWARDFLRRAVPPGAPTDTPRRIYLNRKGFRRQVANIDVDVLQRLDLTPITLDELPYADQARLLRQADLVVADHGAGLAHVVQMQPGTRLVELLPTDYSTPAYQILAHRGRIDYSAVPARPRADDQRPDSQRDYLVDLDEVVAATLDERA